MPASTDAPASNRIDTPSTRWIPCHLKWRNYRPALSSRWGRSSFIDFLSYLCYNSQIVNLRPILEVHVNFEPIS